MHLLVGDIDDRFNALTIVPFRGLLNHRVDAECLMGKVGRFTSDWGRLLPVRRVLEVTADGLTLGAGTILAPGDHEGGLRIAGYEERLLALVSYQIAQLVNGIHGLLPGLAISLINPLTGRRVTYDECRVTDGTLI